MIDIYLTEGHTLLCTEVTNDFCDKQLLLLLLQVHILVETVI